MLSSLVHRVCESILLSTATLLTAGLALAGAPEVHGAVLTPRTPAGLDNDPPVLIGVEPPPGGVGELRFITVTFSEPVTGLGFSDLLINNRPATGLTGSGSTYTFTLDAPDPGIIRVTWDPGAAIHDTGDPPGLFDSTSGTAQWSYELVDRRAPTASINPPQGLTVPRLFQVEIVFDEPVAGVDAGDLTINGQPAIGLTGYGAGPYVFRYHEIPPGEARVEWSSNHGITDLAVPANAFSGDSWRYVVNPSPAAPLVRISEFLTGYSGDTGLRDEDGELQDWIELQNQGATAVNLQGWSLTDDAANPGEWVFPDVEIPAGGYLVVFASAKDRRTPASGGKLHTNFRLGSEGEYLALFDAGSPRGRVSAFVPIYPAQRNDISFGYDREDRVRYFPRPTPGAANAESAVVGVVPAVDFNVHRGLFHQPFELHLSSPLDGAEIRYTTDGSEPRPVVSPLYSGPFAISNTTVLRAAAYKADHLPSVAATHTYIFPAAVAHQPADPTGLPRTWIDTQGRSWTADYEMDPEIVSAPSYRDRIADALESLPSISLVTRPADMFDNTTGIYPKSQATGPSWERPASIEFIDSQGGEEFQVNGGVQTQGNSVRDPVKTAKHSFRLLFKGDYGPARLRHRVFPDSPVTEFDTLVLRADFNNSWMHWSGAQRPRGQRVRDAWIKDSQRDMGGLASHSRFYHLYVNGLYWGVYDATERPDAAFAASYLGGAREDFDVLNEGLVVDGEMAAYHSMRALGPFTSNAQYERIKEFLDVRAYIDYVLLHFYAGHEDWFTDKNWYAIRRRRPGEGFRYLSWDGELILNSPMENIVTRTDQASGLHARLIAHPQYRLDFADRAYRHLFHDGALTPEAAAARYQRRVNQVELAMIAESARWGDYRRDVHPYSSGPYDLYTPNEHFAAERARLLNSYFPVRTAILLGQLKAAGLYPANASVPEFNRNGGRIEPGFHLSMTVPTGTIFYTTDGTDPRTAYSGDVGATARPYSSPVLLNSTTHVKARTRTATEWSALNEALFDLDPPGVPLAITEIHYHPAGGDPYEFVELLNLSTIPFDASGFAFDGIRFVFPPGSMLAPGRTVVLASSLSPLSFAQIHPTVSVFGYFEGNLSDGGERLAVLDRDGRTVTSVDFSDSDGWPQAADGQGPSLECLDPRDDPDAPANWRASPVRDGTPGTSSSPPFPSQVRLNEVMTFASGVTSDGAPAKADWIELRNEGSNAVDLGGWRLTDSSQPDRYVFPTGTSVPAAGYLTVWCDPNSAAPGLHAGFALDHSGGTVSLFDAQGIRVDALTFGVQLPDLSLGRIGDAGAWQLCDPSPDRENVPHPLAPPSMLSINEWMANPLPGADAWIELYNRDDTRPAALRGTYLQTDTSLFRLAFHSLISPKGHLRLWADQRPGSRHLDFKLPAAGTRITLLDPMGLSIDDVSYASQARGVSQGRLPDGSERIVPFPHSGSPDSANYTLDTVAGPVLNEILAWNARAAPAATGAKSWVELFNPLDSEFDLDGLSLAVSREPIARWPFPAGSSIPPHGFLVIELDDSSPASDRPSSPLNSGLHLERRAGAVYLFANSGQVRDAVEFGFQAANLPIGRSSDGWRLLERPTPGTANAVPASLAPPTGLRINEWLAQSTDSADWIELYNDSDLPVSLADLQLTDDPSVGGAAKYRFPPLSHVGPHGFVRVDADQDMNLGANHVPFQLDAAGESILLADAAGHTLDAVYFGRQMPGVSLGRSPDGAAGPWRSFATPTPEAGNLGHSNQPPALAEVADQTVIAGSTLVITNRATDADEPAQALRFRLGQSPPGSSIDPTSGVFIWRPSISQALATYLAEIIVTDDGLPPRESNRKFSVTVSIPPVPAFSGFEFRAGRLLLKVPVDAGPDYLLQASTNLTAWETILTNQPPGSPLIWDIPVEATMPALFLRIRLGP